MCKTTDILQSKSGLALARHSKSVNQYSFIA